MGVLGYDVEAGGIYTAELVARHHNIPERLREASPVKTDALTRFVPLAGSRACIWPLEPSKRPSVALVHNKSQGRAHRTSPMLVGVDAKST